MKELINLYIGDLITWESKQLPTSVDFTFFVTSIDFGNKGFRGVIQTGSFEARRNPGRDTWKKPGYKTGIIKYDDLDKINLIKRGGRERVTIKSNRDNEQITKITTEPRGDTKGTIISSIPTRKITTASRLIGNSIPVRVKETRVGEFKIHRNVIIHT
jgi:hypothetical protein